MPDSPIFYSYPWFIGRFESARSNAKEFILSLTEDQFLRPPTKDRWSIAECYGHLINYGKLYFENLSAGIADAQSRQIDSSHPFPPRWHWQKVITFFEPPYKIKLKTISSMKPDRVEGYDRHHLLEEYILLQHRFIHHLENAQEKSVDLGSEKISHPIIPIIKMTLSECFALAEAHQRRHQWQAEQTLKAL